MPFEVINIGEMIKERLETDCEFREAWLVKLQEDALIKEVQKLTIQNNLDRRDILFTIKVHRAALSPVDNSCNSPTLRTICLILGLMGYELKIVKKEEV